MYIHTRPALSKKAMIANLETIPSKSRTAGRNTIEYELPCGTRKLRLHDTDIVTWETDGSIIIDTGGFNTFTTRARLRDAGFNCHTWKGFLYLNGKPFQRRLIIKGETYDSDLTLDPKAITKQIDAFMKHWKSNAARVMNEAYENEAYKGDPWVTVDEATGKYEAHYVEDWMNEGYIFASFYFAADRYAGRKTYKGDGARGLDSYTLRRLRRFTRACLGLAA